MKMHEIYFSSVIRILTTATTRIPNHGLKNGKKAIELSIVATNKLMFVKVKSSSRKTEMIKCSETMRKVAWIRFVIELTNYCFCSEKYSYSAFSGLKYCVVK